MYYHNSDSDCFQVDNGCVTTQNVPCVFPFTYDGLWFPACVNVRKMLPMDQYWCSTKTNADGTHVEGQWGLCGEQCPKVLYGKNWLQLYAE